MRPNAALERNLDVMSARELDHDLRAASKAGNSGLAPGAGSDQREQNWRWRAPLFVLVGKGQTDPCALTRNR